MKQKSLANKVFNEIIKFKSDMLKSKTVKCVGKNVLPDYKKSRLIFFWNNITNIFVTIY